MSLLERRTLFSVGTRQVADWSRGLTLTYTVLGPTGRGVDRRWLPAELVMPKAVSPEPHQLVWRLATPVPSTWIPFVGGVMPDDGSPALVKARLLDTPTTTVRKARSRILADLDRIHDEEVSSAGCRIGLVDQLVRWYDGRPFAWRGREKRPGRGEASSLLRFDAALPTE